MDEPDPAQTQQGGTGQEDFKIRGYAERKKAYAARLQDGLPPGQGNHGPTGDLHSGRGLVNARTDGLSGDSRNANYDGGPGRVRDRNEGRGGNGSRGGSGGHQEHRRNDNNDRGAPRGRVGKPYQGGHRDRRPPGGRPA